MILHNLLGSSRPAIYECPDCSMEFQTKLMLTSHLRCFHGENQEGKPDILLTAAFSVMKSAVVAFLVFFMCPHTNSVNQEMPVL